MSEPLHLLQLAEATLRELHDLLPQIGCGSLGTSYYRMEFATAPDPSPRRLGDKVLTYPRSAEQSVAVVLNQVADVSVRVGGPDWTMPIEDFTPVYLRPAAAVLAHQIVGGLRAALRENLQIRDRAVVGASAPMAVPYPDVVMVACRDGLSLRANRDYDIGLMSSVLTLDVLYGLRTIRRETNL